ncbi:MAG TPA: hypothetical protein PKN32_01150 [Bacteroidales bacterium]|nr:hypothetical protein [Bacteroidales bacterium]
MKIILLAVISVLILQSCSLLYYNPCKSYISDDITFRAYSEASSTNEQFAEEKALLIAKTDIAENVDNYIVSKYGHQTFLHDPEYENKISIVRKTVLNNINIVCSKTIVKKGMYKSYIAIEISKEDIDKEVTRKLKEQTD